jgi:hypothetical protein
MVIFCAMGVLVPVSVVAGYSLVMNGTMDSLSSDKCRLLHRLLHRLRFQILEIGEVEILGRRCRGYRLDVLEALFQFDL